MRRCHLLAILALALPSTASPARAAGLAWARTSVEVTARPGQRVVDFEFPFQNNGEKPVTLVSIEASCRCLAVNGTRKTYGPGEKGVVGAAFAVGEKPGVREESITVKTDEPDAKPVELLLRVNVPGAHP